jgi:LPXTG-motif cell wall-anchored protein
MNHKTAIFSGKAIKVTPPEQKEIMSSADPVSVTFEVEKVWKGDVKQKTVVRTALSSASCGIEDFAVNTEYVVYAYGAMDQLETNICDRTKPLASAGEDIAELGKGYEALKISGADDPQDPAISASHEQKQNPAEKSTEKPTGKPAGYYWIPLGGLVLILGFAFSFRRKS